MDIPGSASCGHQSARLQDRSSRWSVTVNLKTVSRDTADECIARARQAGWTVLGQLEEGEQGTSHYQLAVQTPQVRFSAVKKMFPTAHIEVAKDWHALVQYCQKDETRVEPLAKQVSNPFLTWKTVRDKFFEWYSAEYDTQLQVSEEERLKYWDTFIGLSIREGMEVDVIGVNPQYRSCILRYWNSYIHRQTDRQTTQEVVVPTSINANGLR